VPTDLPYSITLSNNNLPLCNNLASVCKHICAILPSFPIPPILPKEAEQNQYILEGIMKNIQELENDIILIENQNK